MRSVSQKKEAHGGEVYTAMPPFCWENLPSFAEDERLSSQRVEGGKCKEVEKSSEGFGSFPGLGGQKLKSEFAKAVCRRGRKIPERR